MTPQKRNCILTMMTIMDEPLPEWKVESCWGMEDLKDSQGNVGRVGPGSEATGEAACECWGQGLVLLTVDPEVWADVCGTGRGQAGRHLGEGEDPLSEDPLIVWVE